MRLFQKELLLAKHLDLNWNIAQLDTDKLCGCAHSGANGQYIASGKNNEVFISDDCVTWQKFQTSNDFTNNIFRISEGTSDVYAATQTATIYKLSDTIQTGKTYNNLAWERVFQGNSYLINDIVVGEQMIYLAGQNPGIGSNTYAHLVQQPKESPNPRTIEIHPSNHDTINGDSATCITYPPNGRVLVAGISDGGFYYNIQDLPSRTTSLSFKAYGITTAKIDNVLTTVIVGNNGNIYTKGSKTITQQIGNINWRGVKYGDGVFVAVGSNGELTYSMNGYNWSTPVTTGIGGTVYNITYGDTIKRFLIVSSNGKIAYSK